MKDEKEACDLQHNSHGLVGARVLMVLQRKQEIRSGFGVRVTGFVDAQGNEADVFKRKAVIVDIAGHRYAVRSDRDETHIRTLAKLVSQKIEEVRQEAQPMPTQKLAVLAALNIAEEWVCEQRAHKELKRRVCERSRALLAFLEEEESRHSRGGSDRDASHELGVPV